MAVVLKQKGVLNFNSNDMAYGSMVAALFLVAYFTIALNVIGDTLQKSRN